jgi:hypothetical protein
LFTLSHFVACAIRQEEDDYAGYESQRQNYNVMAFATPLWRPDEVSLRWRSLAERRRSYFVELYNSGRWKQYYTEDAFLAQMHEVVRSAEEWDKLVGQNAARSNSPGSGSPGAARPGPKSSDA